MILKSMGRKTSSYGQLLSYITNDKSITKDANGNPILLLHNTFGKSLKEIEQEFKDNEALRVYHRKDVNRLYHEILSWHYSDTPNIDVNKIETIAREYFRQRNEMAMFVGAIHHDKSHAHFHACVSGTEIVTGKSLNVSKAEFERMKIHLQEFEQNQFPELVHSQVAHDKRTKDRITNGEYQMQKNGKVFRKQEVKQIVEECFNNALSKENFYDQIIAQGLEVYERNGVVTGVSDSIHMRFSTMGFGADRLAQLDNREERVEELQALKGEEQESEIEKMKEEMIVKQRQNELDDLTGLNK